MNHRCIMPGCGRFVRKDQSRCDGHLHHSQTPHDAMVPYLDALRSVLERLLAEIGDVDILARHVPRLVSTAIQGIRIHEQMGGKTTTGSADGLQALMDEVGQLAQIEDTGE